MSFKPMVTTKEDNGNFCVNGLNFATRQEAEASAADLASRFFLVTDWKVEEFPDAQYPVNYKRVDGRDVPIETEEEGNG